MTRRVPASTRAEITRVAGRVHRRTISRGSEGPASGDWLNGDLAVVRAALDKLAGEIAENGMAAFIAVMEGAGLRSGIGRAEALRAIRQFVAENLHDALRDRIAEIDGQPELVARLQVASTRETLIELLGEYACD